MRARTKIATALVVAIPLAACAGADRDNDGDGASSSGVEVTSTITTEPSPDSASATEPLSTEPPMTEPSVTEPAGTEPPATEPPVTEPPVTEPPVTEPPTPAVFAFPDAAAAEGWLVINDTVMGGVSSGELNWQDGELVFTGDLSLDNNGGFVSMRSPGIDPAVAAAWAGRVGPRVRATGDGRPWVLEVRTDESFDGGWIAPLPTDEDSSVDLVLPWTEFEPVTRFLEPRQTDTPLDPARIVSVAFYLLDGVEAPFRFALTSLS